MANIGTSLLVSASLGFINSRNNGTAPVPEPKKKPQGPPLPPLKYRYHTIKQIERMEFQWLRGNMIKRARKLGEAREQERLAAIEAAKAEGREYVEPKVEKKPKPKDPSQRPPRQTWSRVRGAQQVWWGLNDAPRGLFWCKELTRRGQVVDKIIRKPMKLTEFKK